MLNAASEEFDNLDADEVPRPGAGELPGAFFRGARRHKTSNSSLLVLKGFYKLPLSCSRS